MNLNRVDFIKIDVEGMEFEAVYGAAETIQRHTPHLLIENIKIDKQKMQDLLSGWGMKHTHLAGTFLLCINLLRWQVSVLWITAI